MAMVYDAAEARAAILEDERRYHEALRWCRCRRAIPCRVYGGHWACRLCERLIRNPVFPGRSR